MSTEKGKKKGIFFLPVLLALPLAAALVYFAIRFGPTARKLISVLIKLVVSA